MKYQPLISQQIRLDFYRIFTKRVQPLLDLYEYINIRWQVENNDVPMEGFNLPPSINIDLIKDESPASIFKIMQRVLLSGMTDEVMRDWTLGELAELRILGRRWFTSPTTIISKDMISRVGRLLEEVAAHNQTFIIGKPVGGVLRTVRFRKTTSSEEDLERVKREDPALYERIQGSKKALRNVVANIEAEISAAGMTSRKTRISGRFVVIGKDILGNEFVYQTDGNVVGLDDYIAKVEQEDEALKRLQTIEKGVPSFEDLTLLNEDDIKEISRGYARKTGRVWIPDMSSLRIFKGDLTELPGDVEYVSLSDDAVKSKGIMRVYPVKDNGAGKKIIVDGRFKGIYIEDVINQAGRLIERTAYDYNPKTGSRVPIEGKDAEGKPVLNVFKEPYVTVTSDGKLLVKIPRNTEHTPMRQAAKELTKASASFTYEEQTSGTTYTFEAKDFGILRQAIGGFAMSKSAVEKIEEHYLKMAKISAAQTPEVSRFYSAEKIGGFKEDFDFREVQKQSLAWSEARGWSGMLALSVGLGKTTVAVGAMQKMYRDGLAGEEGRFLYVCPNQLKGNLPRELKFASEDAESLIERTDIISYEQFIRSSNKDSAFADSYIAVFFDECQDLRTNSRLRAVSKINNPRKIFLSASPMSKDPDEVFINVALTNNIKMFDDDGKMNREFINQRRKWKARYAEVVGGRVMGITQDPLLRKEFQEWVGSNVFFRSPEDAPEINLPELRATQEALTMDPVVEEAYRKAAKGVSKVIKDIVRKYEQGVTSGLSPSVDSFRGGKTGKALRELQVIQDMPDTVIPGATNPKLNRSIEILKDQISKGGRTLMFTDSTKFAKYMVTRVSKNFPGRWVAVALANSIEVYSGGRKVETYKEAGKYVDSNGKRVPKSGWRSFVLSDLLQNDPRTLALILTAKYAVGQNLQSFSSIIQLDRDTWSGETMKQRTGRAWRQGQKNPVEEHTLDVVYGDPKGGGFDPTLDEARAAVHRMENNLFDEVIVEAQGVELGTDYTDMKKMNPKMTNIDRKLMESALSPYATRIADEDTE